VCDACWEELEGAPATLVTDVKSESSDLKSSKLPRFWVEDYLLRNPAPQPTSPKARPPSECPMCSVHLGIVPDERARARSAIEISPPSSPTVDDSSNPRKSSKLSLTPDSQRRSSAFARISLVRSVGGGRVNNPSNGLLHSDHSSSSDNPPSDNPSLSNNDNYSAPDNPSDHSPNHSPDHSRDPQPPESVSLVEQSTSIPSSVGTNINLELSQSHLNGEVGEDETANETPRDFLGKKQILQEDLQGGANCKILS